MRKIIAFVGRHNAGKTTVVTEVITRLEQKGITTAVIKHASRLDFDSAHDSDRFFAAGAHKIIAVSADSMLCYTRQPEITWDELIEQVDDKIDLIILEGYKDKPGFKVEVLRQSIDSQPLALDRVIAQVADFKLDDSDIPVFNFDQIALLAEFIIATYDL